MKSSCMSCFYLNKVDMLKSKFGFNHAFSYKEEHDLHFDRAKKTILVVSSNWNQ